jgi:hypothetical protein
MERSFVFLASTSYAGSTLLSFLLGAHPEIATTSDVSGVRRQFRMNGFECSCGRRMVDCAFWNAVADRMRARGYPDFRLANFGLGFDYLGLGYRSKLLEGSLPVPALEPVRDAIVSLIPGHLRTMRAIADRNRDFAHAVMDVTGGHVFVDASKERMRTLHLQRHVAPKMELRIIHLVRDVRGVVESNLRRKQGDGMTPGRAARNWARTNEIIVRNLRSVPADRQTMVRYEELCADPDGTMSALFAFCGVDPGIRVTDLDSTEQHLIGNEMRLASLGEIRLDERWRASLGVPELDSIRRVAGAAYARLYPDGEPLHTGGKPVRSGGGG